MRKILAAFLLWLSLVSTANADISFVSGAELGSNSTSGTTLSVPFTVSSSANRILVIFVVTGDVIVPTLTVTYNGIALSGPYAADSANDSFWILVNPTSGANTVLITDTNCSGPNCFLQALAAEYAGAAQTGQPDTTGIHTVDSIAENTYTTTVGPTVANRAWMIGAVIGGGGGTPVNSMTAPFTARVENGTGSFVMMGDAGPISPASTVSFAATMQNAGATQNHYTFSIAPTAALSDKGSMMLMGCCR